MLLDIPNEPYLCFLFLCKKCPLEHPLQISHVCPVLSGLQFSRPFPHGLGHFLPAPFPAFPRLIHITFEDTVSKPSSTMHGLFLFFFSNLKRTAEIWESWRIFKRKRSNWKVEKSHYSSWEVWLTRKKEKTHSHTLTDQKQVRRKIRRTFWVAGWSNTKAVSDENREVIRKDYSWGREVCMAPRMKFMCVLALP